MATYLADTSAWNRSTAVADRWEELLSANDIGTCGPVRLELLYSARSVTEFEELSEDLGALPDFPLDDEVVALAEETQERLAARSQHRGPKPIDLVIAATAAAYDLVLLHYDRHFEAIGSVTGQQMEWVARRGSLD